MRSPLVLACLAAGAALAGAPPAVAQPGLSAPHTTIDTAGGGPKVVASVGDVNGDGREDLFVQRETESGEDCRPTAHIVLGAAAGTALSIDGLGSRGITITDLPGCVTEWGVAALGDVNGDGKGDVGLADDGFTAKVRPIVIFGRAGGSTASYAAPGTGGITFDRRGDRTVRPTSIHAVGDVNGDGRADVGLGGGYGTAGAYRTAAGVLFGRATGGTVDLTNTTTAGLLIGDPASAMGAEPSTMLFGVGDVNGDGKADIATSVGGRRVVYGRSAPGFIDTRSPGIGATLAGDSYGVFSSIDAATLPDLNGDGARELSSLLLGNFAYSGGVSIVLSGRSAPHYGLAGTPAPLQLSASLGVTTGVDPVNRWKFFAVDPGGFGAPLKRLPAGTYTAVLKATDMAGNAGATKTATIQVTG